MTDQDFDKLEKEYDKYCEVYNAPNERRWSDVVGFSWDVPLTLFPQK